MINSLNWKNRDIKYYVLVFLACFIPRALLAVAAIPLRTPSDEFSTMFFGAFLGGNDWSAVESYANYYGFGMSFLTWWIYKLPISIIYKYKLLLCFCGFLQSCTGIIAYTVVRHYANISKTTQFLIAIAASYMVVTRNTVFYNEHALILISWLLTFLVVKWIGLLQEGVKNSITYPVAILSILGASFTVHTRAITLVAAISITLIMYVIFETERSTRIFLFIIAAITVYYIVGRVGVSQYISIFFNNAHRELTNSQIAVPKMSFRNIIGIVIAGVGQFGTILMASMGMVLVGVIGTVSQILQYFKNGKKIKIEPLVYGQILMLISVMITIVYHAMTWGDGEYILLWQSRDTEYHYVFKILTYVRYIGPYIGPVYLAGLLELLKQHSAKWYALVLIGYILLITAWFRMIFPFVIQTSDCSEAFICWVFNKAFATGKIQYYLGFLIATVALLFILISSLKNRHNIVLLIVLLLLGYQYGYNAIVYDINEEENQYKKVDGTLKVLAAADENGIDYDKSIFAIDATNVRDHQFYYTLQVYLENYIIKPELEKRIPNKGLIITNDLEAFNREYVLDGFASYYIDDNEAVLTKNSQLIRFLDESDFVFRAFDE